MTGAWYTKYLRRATAVSTSLLDYTCLQQLSYSIIYKLLFFCLQSFENMSFGDIYPTQAFYCCFYKICFNSYFFKVLVKLLLGAKTASNNLFVVSLSTD